MGLLRSTPAIELVQIQAASVESQDTGKGVRIQCAAAAAVDPVPS